MERIEVTGKTVEEAQQEAIRIATEKFGVTGDELEFTVLEEPRSGLFGRTRGEARVQARLRPLSPRPKKERRRKPKRNDGPTQTSDAASDTKSREKSDDRASQSRKDLTTKKSERPAPAKASREADRDVPRGTPREQMPVEEQIAVLDNFLVSLGSAFDLKVTTEAHHEDGRLTVSMQGEDLGILIGPRMATLEAIQDVAKSALQREAAGREYARIIIDVQGIREKRVAALEQYTKQAAQDVIDNGHEAVFEVMSSIDRKRVHDMVAQIEGVESGSIGEDPRRRVVLRPKSVDDADV